MNIAANLRFEIIVTGNCIPIDIGIALTCNYVNDFAIDARIHT